MKYLIPLQGSNDNINKQFMYLYFTVLSVKIGNDYNAIKDERNEYTNNFYSQNLQFLLTGK